MGRITAFIVGITFHRVSSYLVFDVNQKLPAHVLNSYMDSQQQQVGWEYVLLSGLV